MSAKNFFIVNGGDIMAGNKNLNSAARAKKDEFYTQLTDIERELQWYRNHFAGKTIFCNCDDPFESQFFFFFAMNFNFLKLKRLIVTSYTGSPVQGDLFNPVDDDKPAYKVEINRIDKDPFDWTDVTALMNELKDALGKNNSATVNGNTLSLLNGDGTFLAGDFRSAECVGLLKQADIVVTNPPFSLFREFVAQLVKFDKKFLIIGNINCITYKEIFPLIMQNKVWLGISIHSGDRKFNVPENYSLEAATCGVDENDKKFIRVKGVRWFTNLENAQRHRKIEMVRSYKDNPEMFPRYDNYDAIEVSRTENIPEDYFGVMGVPITFLDKHCPEQFDILGITDRQNTSNLRIKKYTAEDSPKYNDLNARSVLKVGDDYKPCYARILIRRRQQDVH
jgi:hypothetical protein